MPYSDLSDAWNSYDPRYNRVTDDDPTYGGLLQQINRDADLYPEGYKYPDEDLTPSYRQFPVPSIQRPVYKGSSPPPIIPIPSYDRRNKILYSYPNKPGPVFSDPDSYDPNPIQEEGPTPRRYLPDRSFISYNQGGNSLAEFDPSARSQYESGSEIQGPTRPGFNDPAVLARVYNDIQRDLRLNPEQALGFLSNLNAESFGFAKAQEEGPQIRGRNTGGLGWGQWTAGRRAAFEDYLRQTGTPPTSYEGNYGFLTTELQDPKWQPFLENLRRQRDAESATRYTETGYENPSRKTGRQDWLARTRRELPASAIALGQVRGAAPPAPNSLETARPYTSLPPNYLRPQSNATGSSELYRENFSF